MEAEGILEYWMGPRHDHPPEQARMQSWFAVDEAKDEEIRLRFGEATASAIEGGFVAWEADPRERAALLILLDQFSRNLYRGSTRAFAGDPRATELVRGTTKAELDRLHPVECYFTLMPLMHSESLPHQDRYRAKDSGLEQQDIQGSPIGKMA